MIFFSLVMTLLSFNQEAKAFQQNESLFSSDLIKTGDFVTRKAFVRQRILKDLKGSRPSPIRGNDLPEDLDAVLVFL